MFISSNASVQSVPFVLKYTLNILHKLTSFMSNTSFNVSELIFNASGL